MPEDEKHINEMIQEIDDEVQSSSVSMSGVVLITLGVLAILFGGFGYDLGWLIIGGVLVLAGTINSAAAKICNEIRKIGKNSNK